MNYKLFENLVYELEKLLTEHGASVFLNQRVRDEFTGNLRQVDIVIDRQGHRTCVECRAHRPKQDVKWIEELVGRAASIGANEIIGASLSGFTLPAIKMARARGIGLRDLSQIDKDDVTGWGKPTEITYYYCLFDQLTAKINFLPQYNFGPTVSDGDKKNIFNILISSSDFINSFQDLICRARGVLGDTEFKEGVTHRAEGRIYFGSNMVINGYYVSSVDVEVSVQYLKNTHQSTYSSIYRDPSIDDSNAVGGVSLFDDREWKVLRSKRKSKIFLDCKQFDIRGNAMVYKLLISGLSPQERFDIEVKNPLLWRSADQYAVKVFCSFKYTPIVPYSGAPQLYFGDREVGAIT